MRTPAQVTPFHRALVRGQGGQATKSCANSTCRASARYSILPRSAPSPSLALFTVSTRADCYCYCRSNFIIDEAWCPHAGDAPVEYIVFALSAHVESSPSKSASSPESEPTSSESRGAMGSLTATRRALPMPRASKAFVRA